MEIRQAGGLVRKGPGSGRLKKIRRVIGALRSWRVSTTNITNPRLRWLSKREAIRGRHPQANVLLWLFVFSLVGCSGSVCGVASLSRCTSKLSDLQLQAHPRVLSSSYAILIIRLRRRLCRLLVVPPDAVARAAL